MQQHRLKTPKLPRRCAFGMTPSGDDCSRQMLALREQRPKPWAHEARRFHFARERFTFLEQSEDSVRISAAAQSFLHDFAGLTMFAAALFGIFAADNIIAPMFYRRSSEAQS